MTISVVGITTAQIVNANTISITPHASAVAGDLLIFFMHAFRSDTAAAVVVTPPSGLFNFMNTNLGPTQILKAVYFTTSTTYTWNFSVSTICADIICVVMRGMRKQTTGASGVLDPAPLVRSGESSDASYVDNFFSAISLGDISTTTENNLLLCFGAAYDGDYVTHAPSMSFTPPGGLTLQWSITNSQTNQVRYMFFATADLTAVGNYNFTDATHNTKTHCNMWWCVMCPDTAIEPHAAEWQYLGFFSFGSSHPPLLVPDTSGPYMYHVYSNSGAADHIRKIDRVTLLEVSDTTYSFTMSTTFPCLTQDATYLYISGSVSGTFSIYQIRKSDMAVIQSFTVSNLIMRGIALGRGWNAGKIWALDANTGTSTRRVQSWNLSTGLLIDTVPINTLLTDPNDICVDSTGNLYITGLLSGNFYLKIITISSSLTATLLKTIDGTTLEHKIDVGAYAIFYDDTAGDLVLINQYASTGTNQIPGQQHRILKLSTGGTILEDVCRMAFATRSVLNNNSGLQATFDGQRVLILGEKDFLADQYFDGTINLLDATTLAYVNTIRAPSNRIWPTHCRIDAEGRIWALLVPASSTTVFYVYVLTLPESTFERPLFGRGHGWRRGFDGQ